MNHSDGSLKKRAFKWISRNWDTFSLIPYTYKSYRLKHSKNWRGTWMVNLQTVPGSQKPTTLSLCLPLSLCLSVSLSLSLFMSLCLSLSLCLSVSESSVQPQSGRLLCQLWQCSLPASTLWIGVNRLWPRQRPARPDCYNGISVCVCACAES